MSKKAYTRKTDEELLSIAVTGEREAFDEIVARHQPFLILYCHRILNDHDEAADAANRVWMKLWSRRMSLTFVVNFRSYLIVVARSMCVDISRSRINGRWLGEEQIPVDMLPIDPSPTPESHLMAAETLRFLKEKVPEPDLQILILRFYHELDASEIGHALGLSSATVRKRLQRSLNKLKIALERE